MFPGQCLWLQDCYVLTLRWIQGERSVLRQHVKLVEPKALILFMRAISCCTLSWIRHVDMDRLTVELQITDTASRLDSPGASVQLLQFQWSLRTGLVHLLHFLYLADVLIQSDLHEQLGLSALLKGTSTDFQMQLHYCMLLGWTHNLHSLSLCHLLYSSIGIVKTYVEFLLNTGNGVIRARFNTHQSTVIYCT